MDFFRHLRKKWSWSLGLLLVVIVAVGSIAYHRAVDAANEEDRLACGTPNSPTTARERREDTVERHKLQQYLDTNADFYTSAQLSVNLLRVRVDRVVGHRAYLAIDPTYNNYFLKNPLQLTILSTYSKGWNDVFNDDETRSDNRTSIELMTRSGNHVLSTCRSRAFFGLWAE